MKEDIITIETLLYICFVVFLLVAVFCCWDTAQIRPLAAENALQQCHAEGYSSYVDYQRTFLSTRALAVRCEQPIKNYNIEGGTALIAVEE
jgi:hypothetical protein